jgi:hypothetical protein
LTRNSHRQLSQLRIDHPTDDRAEDRAERQRQTDRGDQVGAGVPTRGLHAEGLHQREDQPGSEALQDPEADQAHVAPRQRAEDGAEHEQHQRGHPDPFAAPPTLRPSGGGDRDRHR